MSKTDFSSTAKKEQTVSQVRKEFPVWVKLVNIFGMQECICPESSANETANLKPNAIHAHAIYSCTQLLSI